MAWSVSGITSQQVPPRDTLKSSNLLSITPLLNIIRTVFTAIPDERTGKFRYTLPDVLMSAAAVFALIW